MVHVASVFLVAAVLVLPALAPVAVYGQTVVRIGYSGGVAKNLHKLIERAGVWKKRGLDVRPIYFTSGATMAQAMVGSDIDVADSDGRPCSTPFQPEFWMES